MGGLAIGKKDGITRLLAVNLLFSEEKMFIISPIWMIYSTAIGSNLRMRHLARCPPAFQGARGANLQNIEMFRQIAAKASAE